MGRRKNFGLFLAQIAAVRRRRKIWGNRGLCQVLLPSSPAAGAPLRILLWWPPAVSGQVPCTARRAARLCRTRSWGQPARRSGSLACWAQRSLNEPPTSRRVVWVAARHADHSSAAGAVRHKVKGDRDGEYAYVRDACVERALTCRRRSMLPRMLTRTCFALPGRLGDHFKSSCMSLFGPFGDCAIN